jgi:hypothetical protein
MKDPTLSLTHTSLAGRRYTSASFIVCRISPDCIMRDCSALLPGTKECTTSAKKVSLWKEGFSTIPTPTVSTAGVESGADATALIRSVFLPRRTSECCRQVWRSMRTNENTQVWRQKLNRIYVSCVDSYHALIARQDGSTTCSRSKLSRHSSVQAKPWFRKELSSASAQLFKMFFFFGERPFHCGTACSYVRG